MQNNKVYRVCTACKIHHFENCESCWGFGVYSDTLGDAVRAVDAHDKVFNGAVYPCPECGSTENGLPNNTYSGQPSAEWVRCAYCQKVVDPKYHSHGNGCRRHDPLCK